MILVLFVGRHGVARFLAARIGRVNITRNRLARTIFGVIVSGDFEAMVNQRPATGATVVTQVDRFKAQVWNDASH